ncbi:helix-turn-helix domain-containing protein [Aquirhabdus parva]|uniref:Helix-turn-helix domain-containing protein n=1 Tax=Aquirhabdus parva TaxID=2283318 RepID=A0A345PAP7_9GAMM|nr:hypothetical protein [Aquirhabdus parva]AXI04356.1 hypothetical protein HYN46_16845 [Aquirhabdus parva]AXI04400.1 hypothetical protein HYN46_17090 [Aquirhabdus parva]
MSSQKQVSALEKAIAAVGGQANAAAICNISVAAIGRWVKRGHLPRTEYTGETNYAELLAQSVTAQQDSFTSEWLLEHANPSKVYKPQSLALVG